MTVPDTPHSEARPRDGGDQREAPSAIINACHSQVKWHFVMGLVCLALFLTLPPALYQKAEEVRLLTKINGIPPTVLPDCVMGFGAGCGLFALINALFFFRCSNGMRAFAESRKIVDLHRAMRRLRTVWRFFGVSLLLAVAGLMVWRWYVMVR